MESCANTTQPIPSRSWQARIAAANSALCPVMSPADKPIPGLWHCGSGEDHVPAHLGAGLV